MGFVINNPSSYWPGNRIPFEINGADFPAGSQNRQIIQNAINTWNNTGAVQLVARNGDPDFVVFRRHPNACQTSVGRKGGGQDILCAVGSGFGAPSVMHEIGHSLGFYHEQQRPDRDSFVTVDPSVLNSVNFSIPDVGLIVGPYDCVSIMHYPVISGQLSNKPAACPTIGQSSQPSALDIQTANWLRQPVQTIQSAAFPNVYLRMDGNGVTQFAGPGAGTVNCQFGFGPWEQFRIAPQGNGTVVITSAVFRNVCLRLDGSGVNQFAPNGAGTVNCQFGAQVWEKFKLEQQGDGSVAISSVSFPNVYLRMDGGGVTQFAGSGAGTVNCQHGANIWEKFIIS